MMTNVPVNLPGRAYEILIGPGVMDQAGARIAAMTKRRHVAIITDATVAGLHLKSLQAILSDAGLTSDALVLPAGESTKNWEQLQFLAGYGEVVKYGLLGDANFFDWLEKDAPAMAAGDMDARVRAITRSCQMKADIVERDETEQGDRALLNLGHTFCHALEAATGFSDRLLHGEGVAIGCAMAFELSARLGLCSQESPSRVRAHLRDMGMKVDLADIEGDLPDAAALLSMMGQDKKVKVERPDGDFARGYDAGANGESTIFAWLNRGKQSVCLDLKDKADLGLVKRMINDADVLLSNLAPGALGRLGLDAARLRETNKGLIT